MIRKFIYSIHRVLGAVVSLLFLMWFITGLVLVYHPFPNATQEEKNQRLEILPDSLPDIMALVNKLPEGETARKIQLSELQGQTLLSVSTKENQYVFNADTTEEVKPLNYHAIERIAKNWSNAPIERVDTLKELEQWIMYSKYEKELPIYKFYFSDDEKRQLYISSRSGEVQQFTDKDSRFWSWVGFIPHTLYIPALRKHTQTWILTITVLASLGLVMCIAGVYVGIDAYYRRYKRKGKFESPYKKRWYWWHHVVGLIFGIFLLTWAFSGVMSLRKVPQWMVKTHAEYKIPMKIKGKRISPDKYPFDYKLLKQTYPELKKIEWTHFQGIPIYEIVSGNQTLFIDASSKEAKELFLPSEAIEKSIRAIHGDSVAFTVKLINDYENYYLPWKRDLGLPAYKVEVSDADKSLYYINAKTGDYKYLNQNRKARKWMFQALHYFHIKWLMDRPVLWTIVLWTLSIGCIIVSGTGVWLSWRYFRRKWKQNCKTKV